VSLLKKLLFIGSGAGAAILVFPMEYVFSKTTATRNIKYDDIAGSGPYDIADAIDSIHGTLSNSGRHLARMSDGKLYCAYHKRSGGTYSMCVKESSDEGATWTNEVVLQTGSDNDGNAIAVDSKDNLHVVWSAKVGTYRQIYYSMWNGSVWSSPLNITYASEHSMLPVIAVDSNDDLHVTYSDAWSPYHVYYTKKTTPAGWSTAVSISTLAGMTSYIQYHSSIAIDSNDYVHVVWYGRASGYSQAQIWYALWNGSWQTPVLVSSGLGTGEPQSNPCIAVDSSDNLHVVWYGQKSVTHPTVYQIYYAKYDGSWSTPLRISTYANQLSQNQYYPTVALDEDDNIHVLWEGRASGYTAFDCIWYAVYTTSWATPTPVQSSYDSAYPNLRWSKYP
jgi:hypothetical protein